MYLTDPIADMLTRVRNANAVMHEKVDIPHRSPASASRVAGTLSLLKIF